MKIKNKEIKRSSISSKELEHSVKPTWFGKLFSGTIWGNDGFTILTLIVDGNEMMFWFSYKSLEAQEIYDSINLGG